MNNRVSDRMSRKRALEEELQRLEDQRTAIKRHLAYMHGGYRPGLFHGCAALPHSGPLRSPPIPLCRADDLQTAVPALQKKKQGGAIPSKTKVKNLPRDDNDVWKECANILTVSHTRLLPACRWKRRRGITSTLPLVAREQVQARILPVVQEPCGQERRRGLLPGYQNPHGPRHRRVQAEEEDVQVSTRPEPRSCPRALTRPLALPCLQPPTRVPRRHEAHLGQLQASLAAYL